MVSPKGRGVGQLLYTIQEDYGILLKSCYDPYPHQYINGDQTSVWDQGIIGIFFVANVSFMMLFDWEGKTPWSLEGSFSLMVNFEVSCLQTSRQDIISICNIEHNKLPIICVLIYQVYELHPCKPQNDRNMEFIACSIISTSINHLDFKKQKKKNYL